MTSKWYGKNSIHTRPTDDFYRAAAMQARYSHECSVSPSVCPYVKRVHCDQTKAPTENVQLSLMESPLRAFQWAQDEQRTLPVTPEGGLKKRKVAVFRIKNWAFLIESLLQSFFVWKLSAAKL